MKTFKQYLDEKGERPYQFACRTGMKSTTIWNAYNGSPVSGKIALRIHRECGRRVPITSLIEPDLSALVMEST